MKILENYMQDILNQLNQADMDIKSQLETYTNSSNPPKRFQQTSHSPGETSFTVVQEQREFPPREGKLELGDFADIIK